MLIADERHAFYVVKDYMPIPKDVNASDKHFKPAKFPVTQWGNQAPPRVKYSSAAEVIGALFQDVLRTRGIISVPDVQLMLAVRLELCTEEDDRKILLESLMLLADKSTCN